IRSLSDHTIPRSLVNSFILIEFAHYLENVLLKDIDVMSMVHSIETRVPFLDHHLVEHVTPLPARVKLDSAMNKPLLVRALGNDLPREVWDRPKMGFAFPFTDWLNKHAEELEADSREQKFLDQKAIESVWKDFKDGSLYWSRPWATVVLARWSGMRSDGL
ncbi:MAG: asparagine synthase C-terminal domain-containing protein, partial [Nitrososphaera sp.]|nr:asparagine synthase C-terminal domain-containing protein [Nitrososphaera sp.]